MPNLSNSRGPHPRLIGWPARQIPAIALPGTPAKAPAEVLPFDVDADDLGRFDELQALGVLG